MNGKGSKPRPMQISRAQYEANWEAIFGPPKAKRRKPRAKIASSGNSPPPQRHARRA